MHCNAQYARVCSGLEGFIILNRLWLWLLAENYAMKNATAHIVTLLYSLRRIVAEAQAEPKMPPAPKTLSGIKGVRDKLAPAGV